MLGVVWRGYIVVRLEEECGAREWSLANIAIDVGTDTGPIDMRGVGTTLVSEEGAEVPFFNGEEEAVGREFFLFEWGRGEVLIFSNQCT